MGWESKVAYQMLSCFCLLRITSSWSLMASPFALILLFSSYKLVGFDFLSLFFSSLVVFLSTILYIWKHKSVEENVLTSIEKSSHECETFPKETPMLMNETMIEDMEKKEEQGSDNIGVANYDSYFSDLDGSISDEESLIEISLPSGHLMDQHKQEFNQQSLMEFLAEFNEMYEEENLIEIDISIGSIKYSRFEIET
ncbi:unnamed protein product [Trifolium pratense]|uniref:Uncharacterized protein n=1 Tax=Trifolium pratense TaxID=57577 RepID=A0ACB0LIV1_TRIPR|nr:unnamed protein product [Trifolium pratense]